MDPRHIFVFGRSLGGAVALSLADQASEKVIHKFVYPPKNQLYRVDSGHNCRKYVFEHRRYGRSSLTIFKKHQEACSVDEMG